MKSLRLILVLVLWFVTFVTIPAIAVDYTYSTTAKEEWALQQEAIEQGKTKDQLMQDSFKFIRQMLEAWLTDHEKKALEDATPADRTRLGLPN